MEKGEQKVKIVRRTYQTGRFREVREVMVPDRYIPRGPRLKGNARKSQMDANLKAAIREATRILNANFFYEDGDLLVTLSFADKALPATRDEAWQIVGQKLLRKLRPLAKKRGRPLKIFGLPSDMDGQTKETERVHVHLVLSGVTMDEVRETWAPYGLTDCRTIRKEKSHARLAAYLLAQCRCVPDEKKWHTSRNLERTRLIAETEPVGRYRLPKGAELIAAGEYAPEEGKLLDLQIWMPAEKTRARAGGPLKSGRNREASGRGGTLKTRGREGVTPEEGGGK